MTSRRSGLHRDSVETRLQRDLRGLRKFHSAAGRRFVAGVVLYDGTATIAFGEGLFVVPLRTLWEMT